MPRILRLVVRAAVAAALLAMGVAPAALASAMPSPTRNFLGMGFTLEGCVFPVPQGHQQTPGCTTSGTPPSPSGAVGPNDYVEVTNSGYAVWNKSGDLIQQPRFTNTLWAGYPTTDGNACATENDGDGVVRYDRLAGRWIIAQFDLHNVINSTNNSVPSYECVAVSQTGDPTGAYWRYDFHYNAQINDHPRLGIWPDAYYVTYNLFNPGFVGPDVCAWNRAAMLTGPDGLGGATPNTAAENQQCFLLSSTFFGLVPADLDGSVPPPAGSPEYVMGLGSNNSSLNLWKFHVDWTTPGNSSLTGPTSIPVTSFTRACNTGNGDCIPEPSPGNLLEGLGDRPMDRVAYRNFGDHESLVLNHSVAINGAVGVRWYEIQNPNGTPTVAQQGTFAPADANDRWMGAIAQDQAGDMVLGYSLSSSTVKPSVAWAGRLASDTPGQLAQAEAVVQSGSGVETGNFSSGQAAQRWGDWSSMTVDPSDDCTFWYASGYYPANGILNWDTRIAAVKFPGCGANDFSITGPSSVDPAASGHSSAAISTTVTAGTAENLALNVSGLPAGLTASFSPSSIDAGHTSTLTITGDGSTPVGTYPVYVVATAPSAYHGTPLTVNVVDDQAPSCANVTGLSTPYQTARHVTLNCSDPDTGDTVRYAVVTPPSHGTVSAIDSTGHLTDKPKSGYHGPDSFTVKATDNHGLDSNVATVAITVLAPVHPVCKNQSLAVAHNTPRKITLTCSHPAGTSLRWTIVSRPAHGVLSTISPQGVVTYTPKSGYSGPDTFKFRVLDSQRIISNIATVGLKVAPARRTATDALAVLAAF